MARQACEPGMMKVGAGGERESYFKGQHTKPLNWLSGLWGSAEGLQQSPDDAICHLIPFCMCVPCPQRPGGRM